ncbi:MAG: hypothetical protein MUF86_11300 [Akkermansiaceae bacterium]|nr:hypothetical protein [Akkermansiaceae bacterium]
MPNDTSSIENDLRQLHAAGLDESLLARLEACAEESWTNLDPLELHLEHRLRAIAPAPLSAPLIDRLEATLSAVPYPPAQPKIVSFPGRASAARHPRRQWWGAAAAVALFGALAGWLVPHGQTGKSGTATVSSPPARPLPAATVPLVPAGFNRGLSEASDQGVILQGGNQPHRVLKVVYHERVTLKDAEGRTYQVDQPRVEYIIVPTKTD